MDDMQKTVQKLTRITAKMKADKTDKESKKERDCQEMARCQKGKGF
jgi:hypothetical protein